MIDESSDRSLPSVGLPLAIGSVAVVFDSAAGLRELSLQIWGLSRDHTAGHGEWVFHQLPCVLRKLPNKPVKLRNVSNDSELQCPGQKFS